MTSSISAPLTPFLQDKTHILDLPQGVLQHTIGKFLDVDSLKACGLVNHRFKEIRDNPHVYTPEEWKLKDLYANYLKEKHVLDTEKAEKTALPHKERALQNQLHTRSRTWLGWLVSKVHNSPSFIAKVTMLFLSLFRAGKAEIAAQTQLHNELATHQLRHAALLASITNLEHSVRSLHEKYTTLRELLYPSTPMGKAYHHIAHLFGGREHFEKLPELDLQGRVGETDYIDFISPEDMSAPIMRGKDHYNRLFLSYAF